MTVRFAQRMACGLFAAASALTFSNYSYAEEKEAVPEIVIIGSLTETPRFELGGSISVISETDIELRQVQNSTDLLRDVPGVAVNRSGVSGGLTQVRIRGAEAEQTLVFIDGIEAFDPAQDIFAFGNLATFDIERIEVLRGSQSALYGSDAVGGVINVITKNGAPGLQLEAEAEGGSFGTYQLAGAVGGGTEQFTARMSVYHFDSEGDNAALAGDENESYENLTLNGRFQFTPNDIFEIEGSARYVDAEAGYDDYNSLAVAVPIRDGVITDASNFDVQKEFAAQIKAGLSLFDEAWIQTVSVSLFDSDNNSISGPDSAFGSSEFPSEGQRLKYQYQSTGNFETGFVEHTITAAVEREELEFFAPAGAFTPEIAAEDKHTSFIGEYRLGFAERVFLSGGVRHDLNDLFEDATTYRVAASIVFPETNSRLHTSYGTGIQNPSFGALFRSTNEFQANPNLQPQESKSFDIGVEQEFFDGRLLFDVTYFEATLDKEITTIGAFGGPVFSSSNEDGESDRRGVELFVNANPFDNFYLKGSYTYTNSEDPDGQDELRRAKHIASMNASYLFHEERGAIDLGVDYNGQQLDEVFLAFPTPSQLVMLDDYVLINLASSYNITDNVKLFARVENLTDADYEENYGYNSSGISGFGGIRVSFSTD